MEMLSPKDSLAPNSLSSKNDRSLWRGGGVEIVLADVGFHFDQEVMVDGGLTGAPFGAPLLRS